MTEKPLDGVLQKAQQREQQNNYYAELAGLATQLDDSTLWANGLTMFETNQKNAVQHIRARIASLIERAKTYDAKCQELVKARRQMKSVESKLDEANNLVAAAEKKAKAAESQAKKIQEQFESGELSKLRAQDISKYAANLSYIMGVLDTTKFESAAKRKCLEYLQDTLEYFGAPNMRK